MAPQYGKATFTNTDPNYSVSSSGAREYRDIPVDEQVELLSMLGDVAEQDGEPAVHASSSSATMTARPVAHTCARLGFAPPLS